MPSGDGFNLTSYWCQMDLAVIIPRDVAVIGTNNRSSAEILAYTGQIITASDYCQLVPIGANRPELLVPDYWCQRPSLRDVAPIGSNPTTERKEHPMNQQSTGDTGELVVLNAADIKPRRRLRFMSLPEFMAWADEQERQRPRLPALVAIAPDEDYAAPTWAALVRHEPRLSELRADVEAVKSRPGFCANAAWYGPGKFRQRMKALVGWEAERRDPFLGTMEAHDAAYHTLYNLLPDCRHQGMCGG